MKNKIIFSSLLLTGICIISGQALARQKNSLLGKTDIHALLEEAPAVPMSVQAAVSRAYGADIINPDFDAIKRFYRPIHEKVEASKKQFEVYFAELRKFQQEQGEEGLKKLTMANSPAVSAPAMPSMPGMKGFTQKYMADKEFAARFDKINESQKEKIVKEFMEAEKAGSSTATIPMDHQKFEQQTKDKNKIKVAMQIQQALSELMQRLHVLNEEYGNQIKSLESGPGSFAELQKVYDQEYAKIPMVVMGEGRWKDPEAVRTLTLKDVAAIRARNAMELSKKAAWFTDIKAKYKLVVNDYNDLLQKYKGAINGSVKDIFNGTNTELELAQFEMGLMDLASMLARFSEDATSAAASIERQQYFRTKP